MVCPRFQSYIEIHLRKYREFLEEEALEEEVVPDILIKCIIKELVPFLKKEKKPEAKRIEEGGL